MPYVQTMPPCRRVTRLLFSESLKVLRCSIVALRNWEYGLPRSFLFSMVRLLPAAAITALMRLPDSLMVASNHFVRLSRGLEVLSYLYVYCMAGMNWSLRLTRSAELDAAMESNRADVLCSLLNVSVRGVKVWVSYLAVCIW